MTPHDWQMPHDVRYTGTQACPPNCPALLNETVSQAFWRLVGEGLTGGDIAVHPAYRRAVKRERDRHDPRCMVQTGGLWLCSCAQEGVAP